MSTSPHQLLLLADHLKLSLLERQRALSLNLEGTKQDAQITRSLASLQQGLDQLEAQQGASSLDDSTSDLARLRRQYHDLYAQFHGTAPPSPTTQQPNDPALAPDFRAAQATPPASARRKSVRFLDNPDAPPSPTDEASRTALFQSSGASEPYRDEPAEPDIASLSNQQIHAHHTSVLREQDAQLDVLGQSIGRQRMLGIQMGSELEEQGELLDDVEAGVDRHSSGLERAQRRLTHVARAGRRNWSWVTIGVLVVVLVLAIVVLK